MKLLTRIPTPTSVRCNTANPSPYLVKSWPLIEHLKNGYTLDIGCGDGRNMLYLKERGFKNVYGCDSNDTRKLHFREICIINLETASISTFGFVEKKRINLYLCNYIFMFINQKARERVIEDMTEYANTDSIAIVEFYDAKQARYPYNDDLMFDRFMAKGWTPIDKRKERFIVKMEEEFNAFDCE